MDKHAKNSGGKPILMPNIYYERIRKSSIKTFVVLGMHRSATSLVAEGISEAGIDMGSYEYRHEDEIFRKLNMEILATAGGNWANVPSEKKIKNAGLTFKKEIASLVAKNTSRNKNWGWKDPKTTLTIECYMPYLVNPVFFACFRNPNEVAESLKVRSPENFTIQKGLDLAKIYNERLLKFLEKICQKY